MTILKQYNPGTAEWEAIVAAENGPPGVQGEQGETGETGIVLSDTEPSVTEVLWGDTGTEEGMVLGNTVVSFVYTDEVDTRPIGADMVFWVPNPYTLGDPFGAVEGDVVLRSTPNVISGVNGITGIWYGTAAEYDALTTDANTLYYVIEPEL